MHVRSYLYTGVALVALILVGELVRSCFFQNLDHLAKQRACEGELRDLLALVKSGETENSPREVRNPESQESYFMFGVSNLSGVGQEPFVAIADNSLQHSKRLSFGLKLQFAVVMLDNGLTLTWEGDPNEYSSLLERAKKDPELLQIRRFWADALNRQDSINAVRDYRATQ